MFKIIDPKNNFKPVKAGFKTPSQAWHWANKNLYSKCSRFGWFGFGDRYFIQKY